MLKQSSNKSRTEGLPGLKVCRDDRAKMRFRIKPGMTYILFCHPEGLPEQQRDFERG